MTPTEVEQPRESALSAVAAAAVRGLRATPKTLPPWLFYDDAGSVLFEDITRLPEYYLTRTERDILDAHAEEILQQMGGPVTLVELGAGSAAKTGLLLAAATQLQSDVLYQPIDVSASALADASASLGAALPTVRVHAQVANYTTESYRIERPANAKVLALYIGSSIGNFAPEEQAAILRKLRDHLLPGDGLLLGTDLAPGPGKSEATLLAAYDDAAGVTAAFNRNVLARLNREADANFEVESFRHQARWNAAESRIEMHLESLVDEQCVVAGETVKFAGGETIHTENSYKFSATTLEQLFSRSGFAVERTWKDGAGCFAVTMALAV